MHQSLNGQWEIAESRSAKSPGKFERTVPVPGLAKLAEPRFAGLSVSELGWLPLETRQKARPDPHRDYFWYRRSFLVDGVWPVAWLRFAKAQFGIKVWVNGILIGESSCCFSSSVLDASAALRPGRNELLVRVGAHPLMLPAGVPCGSDHEKYLWTAGLYDNVELHLSQGAVIEGVQVAPDIHRSTAMISGNIVNAGSVVLTAPIRLSIQAVSNAARVAETTLAAVVLQPGESLSFLGTLEIPAPQLWSPENPFLYEVRITCGTEEQVVRFGLRELRFDTVTRKAYLNGKLYYLRGTNITLHRFFEDEACGTLPWDTAWVRRLLGTLPKRYHWNCMRWSISAVPQCWLDVADEVGLLVEYEFPLWTWRDEWDHETTFEQVRRWMADHWNHPSVAWWSLSNETRHDPLIEMVGRLRTHDKSGRAWSNGYNLPQGENDPVDDHPYKWHAKVAWPAELWSNSRYALATGETTANAPHPSGHAAVANEYCWFWLRRDGSPTELTQLTYERYLPGESTAAERRALYAYYLAAETEHFRAFRKFAGVMHFVYLTCDHPWALTGDLFRDVHTLEMHAEHDEALRHAFAPLGVYLNFWSETVLSGSAAALDVMLFNDHEARKEGTLRLAIQRPDGAVLAEADQPFSLQGLGQHTYRCTSLRFPSDEGLFAIVAMVVAAGEEAAVSRRQVRVAKVLPAEAP